MSTGNPTVTQTGVYKAIDDAWIGLLILSILIFILSLVGLVVLLILWKRFAKQKQLLKGNETFTSTNNMTQPANSSTSRRPVPVHHIEEYPSTNYETQVCSTKNKLNFTFLFSRSNSEWKFLFHRTTTILSKKILVESKRDLILMMVLNKFDNIINGE